MSRGSGQDQFGGEGIECPTCSYPGPHVVYDEASPTYRCDECGQIFDEHEMLDRGGRKSLTELALGALAAGLRRLGL